MKASITSLISIAAILAVADASPVMASVSERSVAEEFALIDTFEQSDGSIVSFYGSSAEDTSIEGSDLSERQNCAADQLSCDNSNVPAVASCNAVIDFLRADRNRIISGDGNVQSLCVSQSGSQCCISWRTRVSGLRAGTTEPTATWVRNACVINDDSGLVNHVDLQGTCSRVCLSNRGSPC